MQTISPLPRPEIDADGLLEYSVVYTDRSLNHMSQKFQTAFRYISATLKKFTAHSMPPLFPAPELPAWRRWRASLHAAKNA